MSKLVRVEIGLSGLPCRIFRNKEWKTCDSVQIMDRGRAVGAIRAQVYDRSESENGNHECERCGRYITWDGFEMHEVIPKGKHGEISLENCRALCHGCHQGNADSAHGNRRWQTSKIKLDKGQND